MNPEIRQTLNTISQNLESANQAAQENIYTCTQIVIDPCLAGIKSCFQDCTGCCFPHRDPTLRRRRGRGISRGAVEYAFDFYDDWDDEDDNANSMVGWDEDDLDAVLAQRSPRVTQPRRQRAMSYGTKARNLMPAGNIEDDQQSTLIPKSSYLGFLERLPFRFGPRALRYKPSAADLQDNPGGVRAHDNDERRPLLDDDAQPEPRLFKRGHTRTRSGTVTSESTTASKSSRGDLIMSDEEDDAVPLDDEFAVTLSRRTTNNTTSDDSSGPRRGSGGKRPARSRQSTRTVSSRSTRSSGNMSQRSNSQRSLGGWISPRPPSSGIVSPLESTVEPPLLPFQPPTLEDLRDEEERVRQEEEMEIEQKREAAGRLAVAKGLHSARRDNERPQILHSDSDLSSLEFKPPELDENLSTPRPNLDLQLSAIHQKIEDDTGSNSTTPRPSISREQQSEPLIPPPPPPPSAMNRPTYSPGIQSRHSSNSSIRSP